MLLPPSSLSFTLTLIISVGTIYYSAELGAFLPPTFNQAYRRVRQSLK